MIPEKKMKAIDKTNKTKPAPINQNTLELRDHLAVDRTTLANERTLLAYIRTALAFLFTGLSLLKFFPGKTFQFFAYFAIGLSFITAVTGFYRFFRVKISLYRSRFPNNKPHHPHL